MEACLGVLSNFGIQTSSFLPRSPAEGDQTSIHAVPALQSAASVTAVFTSLLFRQASSHECVLQRATFATVRCMRRRWNLSLSWKLPHRRLFNARSARRHAQPIGQHPSIERFEPSTSQRKYSFRRKRPIVFIIVADRRFQMVVALSGSDPKSAWHLAKRSCPYSASL